MQKGSIEGRDDIRSNYRIFDLDKTYRVIKSFIDYDGEEHSRGRKYTYLGYGFLPYEDGLTLFVRYNGEIYLFRMQVREESQEEIVHNLEAYFEVVE